MSRSQKHALVFATIHSIAPIVIMIRLLSISDGTERWANTLPLYYLDFPLLPIFLWFQDNPRIPESSFINLWISLILGGLMFAAIGWMSGHMMKSKNKDLQHAPPAGRGEAPRP